MQTFQDWAYAQPWLAPGTGMNQTPSPPSCLLRMYVGGLGEEMLRENTTGKDTVRGTPG